MKSKSYSHIAPFYDWIMEHVDYPEWSRYISHIGTKHGMAPKRILELAAGTCPFAACPPFPQAERTVYSDLSFAMLRQAKPAGSLFQVACDSSGLPFKKSFDFCYMMYDSFNHLMDSEAVALCLEEVGKVLLPNGYFLFDITTAHNSRTYFSDAIDFAETQEVSVIRESWYDEKNALQNNRFTYFKNIGNGHYQRVCENYQQKIYSLKELLRQIEDSPLTLAASYDDMTTNPPHSKSERIHLLLRS